MRILCILLLASAAAAETFPAVQKRGVLRDRAGELSIGESGIEFRTPKRGTPWVWAWTDIQFLDRVSGSELDVLTYEDSAVRLGRDRRYRFVLADGEIADDLWARLRTRFGRPVADRAAAPLEHGIAASIPVKRLRGWFGSEGRLVFAGEWIAYETDAPGRARAWRLGDEAASVWSAGRYELEVHVRERGRRDVSKLQVYRFDLKSPLPAELYRRLKLRLYRTETSESR